MIKKIKRISLLMIVFFVLQFLSIIVIAQIVSFITKGNESSVLGDNMFLFVLVVYIIIPIILTRFIMYRVRNFVSLYPHGSLFFNLGIAIFIGASVFYYLTGFFGPILYPVSEISSNTDIDTITQSQSKVIKVKNINGASYALFQEEGYPTLIRLYKMAKDKERVWSSALPISENIDDFWYDPKGEKLFIVERRGFFEQIDLYLQSKDGLVFKNLSFKNSPFSCQIYCPLFQR